VIFFGSSLLLASLVSFQALLFLILYQALATIYSLPPFRLKQYLGVATFVAALAGTSILSLGYVTLAPDHSLRGIPLSLLWYLIIAYSLSLPLKDFKDTAGDKKDSVYTLPVLLGEKRALSVMSIISFLVFMASVLVLRAPQIFLWAFLFASASFWLLHHTSSAGRLSFRRLPAYFLGLVFLYGLGLVVFLT
jgi:4-hydroxybenzoate polyprenyltransferase